VLDGVVVAVKLTAAGVCGSAPAGPTVRTVAAMARVDTAAILRKNIGRNLQAAADSKTPVTLAGAAEASLKQPERVFSKRVPGSGNRPNTCSKDIPAADIRE
jgi:hypothetical protein